MPWIVRQAACSGGGFAQTADQADDGTLVHTYDGGNCYIRNEADAQWENLFHQDRLPPGDSQNVWGQGQIGTGIQMKGINASVLAIAPSNSNYLYCIALSRDSSADFSLCQVWRSTDQGLTWVDTEKRIPLTSAKADANTRGMGRPMVVDPINPLHVIASSDAGVIYRTTDGFATMTCLMATGETLEGVLPSAVTTATASSTSLTFGSGTIPTFVTSPAAGYSTNRYMTNVSDLLSMQDAMGIVSSTSTVVSANAAVTGNSVEIGDTIVFGMRAGIAFDRDSGESGGITQGVYIGWAKGSDGIYASTDGGETFALMVGSPETSTFLECSWDGVLYVCPYTGSGDTWTAPYRYDGSWTALTAMTGSTMLRSCAADPLNPGRVAFARASGGIIVSSNYGTSLAYTPANPSYDASWNLLIYPRTSTDAPQLGMYVYPDGLSERQGTHENAMTHGQLLWDRVVSNRLWMFEGIGCWYGSPPSSGSLQTLPITGFNKNQQSVILNGLMKAPGGTLIATGQDRAGFRLLDPRIEPTGDFGMRTGPTLSAIIHGWGIDYAKDDPNFLVMQCSSQSSYGMNGILVSQDEGLVWSESVTPYGTQAAVACQTTQNWVVFPISGSLSPIYTLDGGDTYSDCSFEGGQILGNAGWGNSALNRHHVCADLNDPLGYFSYNYGNGTVANEGLWYSEDSGATWTQQCAGIAHPTVGGRRLNTAGTGFTIRSVAGFPGQLFIGCGASYNGNYPLMFSDDYGVTWNPVGGTGCAWTMCLGKELPGADYPAIYYAGFNTADADPADAGVFVCTDFDPDNFGDATWTRTCRAPAGNMDPPRDIAADQDTYGKWYLASSGTGYAFGEFREYGALR
jgi:hypothetical protein